ncbi:MAG: hypothetical protein NUW37_15470 [Planctomycetes bacterium]|nr:hypothetical protein [Planctomycetota bacterium]
MMQGLNMDADYGQLQALKLDRTLFVRVIGFGHTNLAPTFGGLLRSEYGCGVRRFVIDLGRCTGLLSAFMGEMALLMSGELGSGATIEAVNVSKKVYAQLNLLGLTHFMSISEMVLPEFEGSWVEVRQRELSRREFALETLDSHKALAKLSPENAKVFRLFIEQIEEELK